MANDFERTVGQVSKRLFGIDFVNSGGNVFKANKPRFDEVDEVLNRETREANQNPRNTTLPVGDMQELLSAMDNEDVKRGKISVDAGRDGTYVITYRGTHTSEMRLSPEAAELAYQSGMFKWNAPVPALTQEPTKVAAPDAASLKPTVDAVAKEEVQPSADAPAKKEEVPPTVDAAAKEKVLPSVDAPAKKEEVQPSADVVAKEADIPAASGPAARRYNSATMPKGLAQNQVGEIQQALIDAGLPVGSRSGKPDEMWGKTSQASFEKLCKEAGIDPKAVNFANLNDPETKAFLKAAEDREQANKQSTAAFFSHMDKVIPGLEKEEAALAEAKLESHAEFQKLMDPKIAGLDKEEAALAEAKPKVDAALLATADKSQDKNAFDQAFAQSDTVENTRAAILAEMNNGTGVNESRVIETYAATIQDSGKPPVQIDGKLTADERSTFESAIGSSINLEDLKELSVALKNAGVADGKQAALGEMPQGNVITVGMAANNSKSLDIA